MKYYVNDRYKNDKISSSRKFTVYAKNEGQSRSIGLREHEKREKKNGNVTDYSERVNYSFLFPESLHDAAVASCTCGVKRSFIYKGAFPDM